MDYRNYLLRLRDLYNRIPNKFEQEIFWCICKKYQESLKCIMKQQGCIEKYCTKEEIIHHLIAEGLMSMSIDKKTKEEKLPDDRSIRIAVRKLMRNGLPILSCSSVAGYYICDDTKEIEKPFNENRSRAKKLLAMEKSYNRMSDFVVGQLDITEIDLSDKEEDEE